jgi:hypothetical protein
MKLLFSRIGLAVAALFFVHLCQAQVQFSVVYTPIDNNTRLQVDIVIDGTDVPATENLHSARVVLIASDLAKYHLGTTADVVVLPGGVLNGGALFNPAVVSVVDPPLTPVGDSSITINFQKLNAPSIGYDVDPAGSEVALSLVIRLQSPACITGAQTLFTVAPNVFGGSRAFRTDSPPANLGAPIGLPSPGGVVFNAPPAIVVPIPPDPTLGTAPVELCAAAGSQDLTLNGFAIAPAIIPVGATLLNSGVAIPATGAVAPDPNITIGTYPATNFTGNIPAWSGTVPNVSSFFSFEYTNAANPGYVCRSANDLEVLFNAVEQPAAPVLTTAPVGPNICVGAVIDISGPAAFNQYNFTGDVTQSGASQTFTGYTVATEPSNAFSLAVGYTATCLSATGSLNIVGIDVPAGIVLDPIPTACTGQATPLSWTGTADQFNIAEATLQSPLATPSLNVTSPFNVTPLIATTYSFQVIAINDPAGANCQQTFTYPNYLVQPGVNLGTINLLLEARAATATPVHVTGNPLNADLIFWFNAATGNAETVDPVENSGVIDAGLNSKMRSGPVPGNAIDFVRLELRDPAAPATVQGFTYGWVLENTDVVDFYTGVGNPAVCGPLGGPNYRLLAWHRNHLPLFTSSIDFTTAPTIDFRTVALPAGDGGFRTQPPTAPYTGQAMIAGNIFNDDGFDNFEINSADFYFAYIAEAVGGPLAYEENQDATLDGVGNVNDNTIISRNNDNLFFWSNNANTLVSNP